MITWIKDKFHKNKNNIIFDIDNILEDDKNGQTVLTDVLNKLENLKNNNNFSSLIINLDKINLSINMIEELMPHFDEIRKKHTIIAYGSTIENHNYEIALLADKIYMHPSKSTVFDIKGYSKTYLYYKKALDKYGIDTDVIHIGDYKNANENFSREEMSEENKAVLTRIFDNNLERMIENISKKRNKNIDEVRNEVLEGKLAYKHAYIAKEKGYIDDVMLEEDIIDEDNDIKLSEYKKKKKYIRNKIPFYKKRKPVIAVVVADGVIMPEENLIYKKVISHKDIKEKIEKLNKIKNLKGILFRVNSPGGSALESNKIYHELKSLDIPIYVSMGTYAASGGYYISMVGEKIYADKTTLTGSIGVVGMMMKFGKALEKFDIKPENISKGVGTNIFNLLSEKKEEDEEIVRNAMLEVYDEFKEIVNNNRKLGDKLEDLAGGRIWMGKEALDNGLVDGIATLDEVLSKLKEDIGVEMVVDIRLKLSLKEKINKIKNQFMMNIIKVLLLEKK